MQSEPCRSTPIVPGASERLWRLAFRLVAGVVVVFLILGFGGVFWLKSKARPQRDAVAAIKEAGGKVYYVWEDPDAADVSPVSFRPNLLGWTWLGGESDVEGPAAPPWLVSMLGVDCFGDVTSVVALRPASDQLLGHIGHLEKLESLRMQVATASEPGMKSLERLVCLKRLTLARSRVITAGFAHLAALKNLEYLNLERTNIDDHAALAGLKSLTALTELNLGGTTITDSGMESLRELIKLEDLTLNNTAISDAGLASLANLSALRRLSLKGTRLNGAGLAHLKQLTKLEELCLEGTGVDDNSLAHLAGAFNLKVLQLKGTAVGDAGVVRLKGLTNLQELTLDRTRITDAGLVELAALPHLGIVSVQHTKVTEGAITEIKRRRAELQVQQLTASSTGIVPPETAIIDLEIVH